MSAVKLQPPDRAVGGHGYVSQAAEEKRSVQTGKGSLNQFSVLNVNAAVRYVFVFDSTTNGGTLLLPPIPVQPNTLVIIDRRYGKIFSTGLYFASSTTPGTYTASTTADLLVDAEYVIHPPPV